MCEATTSPAAFALPDAPRPPLARRVTIAPFIALIKLYQFTLSPVFGRHCRFQPTCSWYALEAYRTHGALRGTLLTGWRIVRCNPFGRGGLDPVPGKDA
jgi:uncharacterized protein